MKAHYQFRPLLSDNLIGASQEVCVKNYFKGAL
jgi:hypothetical protein